MLKGIDVAHHQGTINWDKVKADGIQFAILRMGIGSDIPSQTDKKVLRNAKECDRVGIPYGLYIYSYALNEADAHSEAQHMIRIAKQVNATLGYWYDMEDADSYKAKHKFAPRTHKSELTNFCKIFMEDMKNAGYGNVGVYASYDYFKNILDLDELRKVGKIWLAHWGINEPSIECDMWQYTSDGTVEGIKGRVDMDYLYDDVPVQKEEEKSYEIYTVKAGDTLTKIAKKYNTTVKAIADLNGIKNVNLINVGQRLNIPDVGYDVKVTAFKLNVRKGIGIKEQICDLVSKGDILHIVKEKDGWGLSQKGWVNLKYTEKLL